VDKRGAEGVSWRIHRHHREFTLGARILIIEDNSANMELISYLLTAFGHTPLMAFDGASGVRMAGEEIPDLILCDVHLP
jgi:CheY-like chemotaxis protein